MCESLKEQTKAHLCSYICLLLDYLTIKWRIIIIVFEYYEFIYVILIFKKNENLAPLPKCEVRYILF